MADKYTTYHILKVYDYKGGELGVDLNLNRETFISELSELIGLDKAIDYYFENDCPDEDLDTELNYTLARKILTQDTTMDIILEDCSEYAGGGTTVWEIYECNHNVLTGMVFDQALLDECIEEYLRHYEHE